MEKPMDRTPARDAIADEAVGETLESRAPDAARRAEVAAEEAARRFASGPGLRQASPKKPPNLSVNGSAMPMRMLEAALAGLDA
jgi:hypothetical protein